MAEIRVVKGFRPFFCCPGQGVKDITPPVYEIKDGFFHLANNPVSRQIGMPEHRYQENKQAT